MTDALGHVCEWCGRRPVFALARVRRARWLWQARWVCWTCTGRRTRLTRRQRRAAAARRAWETSPEGRADAASRSVVER